MTKKRSNRRSPENPQKESHASVEAPVYKKCTTSVDEDATIKAREEENLLQKEQIASSIVHRRNEETETETGFYANANEEGRHSTLTEELMETKKTIESNSMDIVELKEQMAFLLHTSETYQDLRRRFMEVYKRNLKDPSHQDDRSAVSRGNDLAHKGDVVNDARIFHFDRRSDNDIFIKLYSLEAEKVLELVKHNVDGGILSVLNAHATEVVKRQDQGAGITNELQEAFHTFIMMMEKHWLEEPVGHLNSPLGQAYYAFWKALNGGER